MASKIVKTGLTSGKSSPTVSVIIPTYNREHLIGQAIDSVLSQTFTDYELIVVNDGSTDDTAHILNRYGDRIRAMNLTTNAGPSSARNLALDAARGEMIALLDSDDTWYPNMLALMVNYLRRHPEIDIVCGLPDYLNEAGQPIGRHTWPPHLRQSFETDLLGTMALGNPLILSATLVRRICFDACGGFDSNLKGAVDWDLWLRFTANNHKIAVLDDAVASYFFNPVSITHDPQRMETASERVLTKLFSDERIAARLSPLRDHIYIQMWLTVAGYWHRAGSDEDRRRLVQKAQNLYTTAPQNKSVSRLHLSRLLPLPETDEFVRIIVTSIPDYTLDYYRRRAFKLIRSGQYKLILKRLNWRLFSSIALGLKDARFRRRSESSK
ncbi:MAG: glycosyltransferase [Anaerolineae bacterium]|nr:glycosyltransferase [Anaerolineae bacterium]